MGLEGLDSNPDSTTHKFVALDLLLSLSVPQFPDPNRGVMIGIQCC